MTTLIKESDLIQSIADAVQFISFYHPADYIQHLARAYEREESPAAKDAIAQILTNSRMRSEEHTSELQSLMRISYAVFCLTKNKHLPCTPPPTQKQTQITSNRTSP